MELKDEVCPSSKFSTRERESVVSSQEDGQCSDDTASGGAIAEVAAIVKSSICSPPADEACFDCDYRQAAAKADRWKSSTISRSSSHGKLGLLFLRICLCWCGVSPSYPKSTMCELANVSPLSD